MHPRFLLICLALTGCSFFAQPIEVSGEHLRIVADTHVSSEAEMRSLLEEGEAFRAAILAISPPDTRPDSTIEVRLHGGFRSQSPYVDSTGTVHLWRFSPEEGGYRALFAHELVHAVAFDQLAEKDSLMSPDLGFYSEGWAEYAALLVDPEKKGFPLFGFAEDVVVGHWVRHGGLTLAALREGHEELNKRCEFQGYILRASWFRYVDEVLGREVLLDLVSAREGWAPDAVEAVLHKTLEEVDADWSIWARARYTAYPDADSAAAAYRARIGWYEPCDG
jgi:hypothetical protein